MTDQPMLEGLVVEPAGAADLEAGAGVFARAMGREDAHVEEWLLEFSRRLAEAGIGHFVIAKHTRTPVGYGSLVAYRNIGWIGFMGTEPEFQGRGVGAAVMRHLLGLSAGMGLKTLKLDATNIGEKLYSKFGFKKEYAARRFEIPGQCTRGTRRDTSGGAVKIVDNMPEWCAALDLRAFGDDRSLLIQAALKHGAKLLVIGKRGFGLLEGKKLGPIVAVDMDTALEIVRWGSGLGANIAYVPLYPELPRRFLASFNLTADRGPITCCTRMRRGQPVAQESGLVYADYSAATG
jgi:GNAT superfamily N-acetyltransferase